ncbi:MAG: hypothetical protein K0R22_3518 [Sporomusa sp.]|jgi:cell division protein FtsB|nr:hypothetical protein [Sporomusa sp.]MDF2876835.1 hypothetical protein [Sporomusa sp.]
MDFKTINKFTLWGLSFGALINLFFFYLEITSQRCDAQEEKKKKAADKQLKNELAELHKEILALKNKVDTLSDFIG